MNNKFPQGYCTWLKPDGEFFINPTEEHLDYLKIHAKHIIIKEGGKYTESIEEFMRETKWIRVRGYPANMQLAVHGIKPFTNSQLKTFKDLEIFGYEIIFN